MYLGIEIGGTKLQLGVGDGKSLDLRQLVRLDVDRKEGAAGICAQIAAVAPELVSQHKVERIGVGFGGPVNMESGTILKSHHVTGWDGFEITNWCAETLGKPAAVGNDCDVSALAEGRFGAGRGHRIVLYVTVGTGIGGGLAVDDRLYAPHSSVRTELGHLRPGLDATNHDDIVESYAAGPRIAANLRRRVSTANDPRAEAALLEASGADSLATLTTKDIARAASAGNPFAAAAFQSATRVLGWAIAQTLTLTAASVVVVGGGVSLAGEELFFAPLRESVATYVFPPLADQYIIEPAALGEDVVVHGAIAVAAQM